jgi:hypothetical protein
LGDASALYVGQLSEGRRMGGTMCSKSGVLAHPRGIKRFWAYPGFPLLFHLDLVDARIRRDVALTLQATRVVLHTCTRSYISLSTLLVIC